MPESVFPDLSELAADLRRRRAAQVGKDGARPLLIAIDGFGGAGKSTVGDALGKLLSSAAVVHIDDFIVKDQVDADSWDPGWDRERLVDQVLRPARLGAPVRFPRFEWVEERLGAPLELPATEFLIVEGLTTLHPTLQPYWDCRIWVSTPIEVASERGRQRDRGNENEARWTHWAANDLDYLERHRPDAIADFVVRNG